MEKAATVHKKKRVTQGIYPNVAGLAGFTASFVYKICKDSK